MRPTLALLFATGLFMAAAPPPARRGQTVDNASVSPASVTTPFVDAGTGIVGGCHLDGNTIGCASAALGYVDAGSVNVTYAQVALVDAGVIKVATVDAGQLLVNGQLEVLASTVSLQGSGSNAFAAATEGARVAFGPDTYGAENGTGIAFTAAGGVSTSAALAAGGLLTGSTAAGDVGRARLRLTANITPVGNGADTTEDNLMTYTLSGGALSNDTLGVHIEAAGDGVNTANATTVKCYFGATAIVSQVLTASQANTWHVSASVHRTGATAQYAEVVFVQGGTAVVTSHTVTTPAETMSAPITVKCTGQRGTSSTANSVRQLFWTIEVT